MRETYLQAGFVRLCWQKLFPLMVLNVLFLLCCLGVLTIPAAATALCRGCQALLLEQPGPFRSFFRAFRAHLLTALPLGLMFPAAPALLSYGCLFYMQNAAQTPFLTVCAVFCLLCACLTCFAACFAYPMLARVELSPWAVIKNSFLLTFRGYAFGAACGCARGAVSLHAPAGSAAGRIAALLRSGAGHAAGAGASD